MTVPIRAADLRAGAASVAPMLIAVVPFGLVAGATPVAEGLGTGAAVGLSTLVFAGASQLAVTDVLADGGSWWIAALTAWTINLRMLLYSASLAPYLAAEPMRRRVTSAYVLTDQAYAVSVARWATPGDDPVRRSGFYLGAGFLLWAVWQVCTLIGALAGGAVPDDVPVDFAIPLVFLVLLVPVLTTRPAIVAATVGGLGAVAAAELGAGPLSLIIGAAGGIAAGTAAEAVDERATRERP
ncbi:MAG TPA: AzlC family ABC transporter permease [Acidimicrobiales bacterium]|nr:AzlC family ABC transporter permease [Acidimicrobiales bacterium]